MFWTDGFPHTNRGTLYWCSRRCVEKDGSDHGEWDDAHFNFLRELFTMLDSPDKTNERFRLMEKQGFLPLVEEVAREHLVLPEELLSKDRTAGIAAARRHLWWELRKRHKLSYPRIGRLVGLDHTTILSGCKKAEKERG